jgi:hypothetical protein
MHVADIKSISEKQKTVHTQLFVVYFIMLSVAHTILDFTVLQAAELAYFK